LVAEVAMAEMDPVKIFIFILPQSYPAVSDNLGRIGRSRVFEGFGQKSISDFWRIHDGVGSPM